MGGAILFGFEQRLDDVAVLIAHEFIEIGDKAFAFLRDAGCVAKFGKELLSVLVLGRGVGAAQCVGHMLLIFAEGGDSHGVGVIEIERYEFRFESAFHIFHGHQWRDDNGFIIILSIDIYRNKTLGLIGEDEEARHAVTAVDATSEMVEGQAFDKFVAFRRGLRVSLKLENILSERRHIAIDYLGELIVSKLFFLGENLAILAKHLVEGLEFCVRLLD